MLVSQASVGAQNIEGIDAPLSQEVAEEKVSVEGGEEEGEGEGEEKEAMEVYSITSPERNAANLVWEEAGRPHGVHKGLHITMGQCCLQLLHG